MLIFFKLTVGFFVMKIKTRTLSKLKLYPQIIKCTPMLMNTLLTFPKIDLIILNKYVKCIPNKSPNVMIMLIGKICLVF